MQPRGEVAAGEGEREEGKEAVLYKCVKSEPSSKLVYKQGSV